MAITLRIWKADHLAGVFTIMCKDFDWKHSKISIFFNGSRTPELYSISPDWYEYCFIYEKFLACGEF
jgi:hypothetical protein